MNTKGNAYKKVLYIDEKIISPDDKIGSAIQHNSNTTQKVKETFTRPSKSIVGRPKIYDLNGKLLASEENLVVIIGREYLAQLISGTNGDNPEDYTAYRITHFGVGDGGTTDTCPPNVNGPFDDNLDLGHRVVIRDPLAGSMYPNYTEDGMLKRIDSDDGVGNPRGEINVVSEQHTINVPGGGEQVIDAYTAIRYRMYLQPFEPDEKPFKFNEAGLYAMEYEYNQQLGEEAPTGEFVLFARFTTLDKYLEAQDGIMIEWYILV